MTLLMETDVVPLTPHLLGRSYDVMNDLMSGTLHRYWKDEFVRMMGPLVSRG